MTIKQYNGSTELHADEGKLLTNGDEVTKVVYLAGSDSADNWREIEEINN